MYQVKNIIFILIIIHLLGACSSTSSPPNPTPIPEKRQNVLTMKNETLSELYKMKPKTRAIIAEAPGYAVFSNANVSFAITIGGGYGVVKNNKTGKHTYMKMAELGIGLGLGVKDYRIIFIFHDKATMHQFIDSGWEFGAQADAAAVADDKGIGAVGGEALIHNITIYQITKTGLALQASVKGTKYWRDDDLN